MQTRRWLNPSLAQTLQFAVILDFMIMSPLGAMIRRYEVSERRVHIRSKLLSLLSFRDRYLFPTDGPVVTSTHQLQPAGIEYSASGALRAFDAARVGNVSLDFPA